MSIGVGTTGPIQGRTVRAEDRPPRHRLIRAAILRLWRLSVPALECALDNPTDDRVSCRQFCSLMLPARSLTPTQRRAFDMVNDAASVTAIVELRCTTGMGRTTMLRQLHAERGGSFLGAGAIVEAMERADPLALEETVYRRVVDELSKHDVVILDDVQLLMHVIMGCGAYPRAQYFAATLTALADLCEASGKHLVVGTDLFAMPVDVAASKGRVVHVEAFEAADYEALGRDILGDRRASDVDFAKLFRFARRLTARQLRRTFESLSSAPGVDTDRVIDELRSQQLASNVDIGEVQLVKLDDLKGIDDVIAALEAHIIIPLERLELAGELDLKPKRGVLLAGPPGTGKTSIVVRSRGGCAANSA